MPNVIVLDFFITPGKNNMSLSGYKIQCMGPHMHTNDSPHPLPSIFS